MNENQWFALYRDMPGIFVSADEVSKALTNAPEDVVNRVPEAEDDLAYRAAQAAGAVVAWWQREIEEGEAAVPDKWIDATGRHWTRDADGHLAPPADLETGSGIHTIGELYMWLHGYRHAKSAPV